MGGCWAGQLAAQLDAMVARGGAGERTSSDDNGIRNFDRVRRQARAAINQLAASSAVAQTAPARERRRARPNGGRRGARSRPQTTPSILPLVSTWASARATYVTDTFAQPVLQFPTHLPGPLPGREFVGGILLVPRRPTWLHPSTAAPAGVYRALAERSRTRSALDPQFIVGMLKFAPSLTPDGQREVTVLVWCRSGSNRARAG